MSRGHITLSPKHGLNPSMLICPICHHETNGIALPGRLRGDAEAPRYMLDREPCDNCKKVIGMGGVMLIEVMDADDGKKDPRRTGRAIGVKREAIKVDIGNSPMAYITESDMKELLGEMYVPLFTPPKEN